MHFPTLDIENVFRGSFTMRRLLLVINRLLRMNGRSALAESLLGESASWSNLEYMLADLIDQVAMANHFTMIINKSEDALTPEFEAYRRPGFTPTERNPDMAERPGEEFASAHEVAGVLSSLMLG